MSALLLRSAMALAAGMAFLIAARSSADEWEFRRYSDYGAHVRFHDQLADRSLIRELAHREAHRYPLSNYDHLRIHQALDRDAYSDYLADQLYHEHAYLGYYNSGFPGFTYGYPTYPPSYAPLAYGYSAYPYAAYGYPAYGGYITRPSTSRFGLYSPRWGITSNFAPW
jgi:hypothetical protein